MRGRSHDEGARRKRAARAALASTAAAAISAAGVAPVRAEPTATPLRVRLEFIRGPGAEECPDEQLLRAETVRAMGGVDPYDAEAAFTMTASIERRRGKLAASMFLRDGDGHGRWFDGFSAYDDCKVLVTAMALSIAVLLDDAAELAAPPGVPAKPASPPAPPDGPCSPDRPCPPKPSPAPPSSPRTASPVRAPPRSSASPVAAERFRWVAGLGAVTGLGMAPGVAIGPALSIGGRWPAWSVALEVRGLASLSQEIDEVPMAASLFMTNAAVCLHRHVLFACGAVELGMLRVTPEVPLGAASSLRLGLGLGGRIGVDWPFSKSLSARGYLGVAPTLVGAAIGRRTNDQMSDSSLWASRDIAGTLGFGLQASL
ncbi:hypothetical protein WME97_01485 [Sorangium sp. So ce367]|uniref:hypothetical protein n=1 Tax=Sorangium sp. So ce367 TaxID=3133305 RepID=UPI003F61BA60